MIVRSEFSNQGSGEQRRGAGRDEIEQKRLGTSPPDHGRHDLRDGRGDERRRRPQKRTREDEHQE
jgi:hypothetical protein